MQRKIKKTRWPSAVRSAEGLIAPSLLSADMGYLKQEVRAVEAAGADWLHLDVMDGHFVPNLTFGPWMAAVLRGITHLPIDAHLMVERPEEWIVPFARAGADLITIHAEATRHLDRHLHAIREVGCRVGVSINPATPLSAIEEVLDLVDLVLIMNVNPGFGGQKLIDSTIAKVERLNELRGARRWVIEVDGGIHAENIARLRRAGADVFVAGSAIFGQKDRKKAVQLLREGLR